MARPKSFLLYLDSEKLLRMLPADEVGRLTWALFEYVRTGSVTEELSLAGQIMLQSMLNFVDRDLENYEKICKMNSEKGKKGGRPKKAQKTCGFSEKAEKPNNNNNNNNSNSNSNSNNNNNTFCGRRGGEQDDCSEPCGNDPLPSPAPQTAPPPLSETDREVLKVKGIPVSYAEERWGRAWEFAMRQKRGITELLEEWWQKDRGNHKKPRDGLVPKTYDLEEFFQAALSRSYDELRT